MRSIDLRKEIGFSLGKHNNKNGFGANFLKGMYCCLLLKVTIVPVTRRCKSSSYELSLLEHVLSHAKIPETM